MKEIWRDIKDYEGLYKVSNLGNVKSLERKIFNNSVYGGYSTIKEKILKPHLHNNGYCSVKLSKNGNVFRITIHRLVAKAFIQNPNNYDIINHKDENRQNNNVNNLEWCTQKYNCNYGTRNQKLKKINELKYGKKVLQYSLDDIFIKEYKSIMDASRKTNINRKCISKVCNGTQKTAGGYKWEFSV